MKILRYSKDAQTPNSVICTWNITRGHTFKLTFTKMKFPGSSCHSNYLQADDLPRFCEDNPLAVSSQDGHVMLKFGAKWNHYPVAFEAQIIRVEGNMSRDYAYTMIRDRPKCMGYPRQV